MTNKRKQKRILKLADFMEKLPPKRFNFLRWVGTDWKGAPDFSCGTTGCALGWATTMPFFRRLGLQMGGVERVPTINGAPIHSSFFSRLLVPSEMCELFGVSQDVFDQLFVPKFRTDNPTPKQWARRARRIYAELQKAETPRAV